MKSNNRNFDDYDISKELKKLHINDVPDNIWNNIKQTIYREKMPAQAPVFIKPRFAFSLIAALVIIFFGSNQIINYYQYQKVNAYLNSHIEYFEPTNTLIQNNFLENGNFL